MTTFAEVDLVIFSGQHVFCCLLGKVCEKGLHGQAMHRSIPAKTEPFVSILEVRDISSRERRLPCAFPLRDDPDYADAIRIETALGIPVLRHDEKKPGGIAEVLAFFEGKGPEGGTVSPTVVVLYHGCFGSGLGASSPGPGSGLE